MYTLSLGLSEMIADYKFIGVYEAEEIENAEVDILSVLPFQSIVEDKIYFENGKNILKKRYLQV